MFSGFVLEALMTMLLVLVVYATAVDNKVVIFCNDNEILQLNEYIFEQIVSRLAPLTMRQDINDIIVQYDYNITSECRQTASGLAPLLIGLTVTAAHLVLIPFTGTSINPARFFFRHQTNLLPFSSINPVHSI